MKKRTQEKGKGASQAKRGRSHTQQSRSRTHGAYVGESLVSSTPTTGMPKGNHKGKGRGSPKGKLDDQSSHQSSNGKGKSYGRGKGSFVPKGKGIFKGKLPKGKGYRTPNTGTSLATLVCGFCICMATMNPTVESDMHFTIRNHTNKLGVNLIPGNSCFLIS